MALFPQKILFGAPHFVAFLLPDPFEGTSDSSCFSGTGIFLDLLHRRAQFGFTIDFMGKVQSVFR
jgi:hypothetical protein